MRDLNVSKGLLIYYTNYKENVPRATVIFRLQPFLYDDFNKKVENYPIMIILSLSG